MRKKLLSLMILFLTFPLGSWALEADTYYLYNVGAKQWLNFGGSDGYTATFFKYGAPVKLAGSGTTFTLQGPFYDSPFITEKLTKSSTAATFTISEVSEGIYTIRCAEGLLGYDGTTNLNGKHSARTVTNNLSDDTSDNAHWQLYTKEQLAARLANATKANPVDATFFISSPEIHRHNTGGFDYSSSKPYAERKWIGMGDGNYGHAGDYPMNYVSYVYNKTINIYQELEGLPAGEYEFSCQGFYRSGSNTTCTSYTTTTVPREAILYAGSNEQPMMSILDEPAKDAGQIWSEGTYYRSYNGGYIPYITSQAETENDKENNGASMAMDNGLYSNNKVRATVGSDGKLRVGMKIEKQTNAYSWTVMDNFQLTYLGLELSDNISAALAEIAEYEKKNTTGDADLTKAINDAKDAVNNAANVAQIEAAVQSVKDAYDTYKNAADYAAAEEAQKNMQPTDKAISYNKFLKNYNLKSGLTNWTATTDVNSWVPITVWSANAPCVAEAYSGWSSLEMTSYSLTQDVILTPGKYRLKAYGFYRWGSSYNSDVNNATSMKRSFAKLVAGQSEMSLMRLADVDPLEAGGYGDYANTIGEAAASFNRGAYENTLVFDIEKTQYVKIGIVGTHDRDKSWCVVGPFTLEKINDDVLQNEAAQALETAKKEYNSYKTKFSNIAKQGEKQRDIQPEGLIPFNADIADADVDAATTPALVSAAIDKMGQELGRFMTESLGTYDLTTLITNPSFELGSTRGWDVSLDPYNTDKNYDMGAKPTSNATYSTTGSVGSYLFNTWWNANAEKQAQYVLQTIPHMPSGHFSLTAGVTSDQAQEKQLRAWHNEDGTLIQSQTINLTGTNSFKPVTTTEFSMKEAGKLRIGVYSNYWFKADNFKLQLHGIEKDRTVATEKLKRMEKVAKQAIEHADFDALLAQAKTDLQNAKSAQAISETCTTAQVALANLLKTYATNTAEGRFDLTPLLGDATFSNGISDWTLGGESNFATWNATYKNVEKFGAQTDFTFTQTLTELPAGPYTLLAQAFFRPRSVEVNADNYEKGIFDGKGKLMLGNHEATVRSIQSDGRYTPSHTSDVGGSNGVSVPNDLHGVDEAFKQHRYWNFVSADLSESEASSLELGIKQETGAQSTAAWMPFDNFRLYYGETPAITLEEGKALPYTEYVQKAQVTLKKHFTAGQYTSLCVPFSTSEIAAFGQVYKIYGQDGNSSDPTKVTFAPVSSIEAGECYVVKTAMDIDELTFEDVDFDPGLPSAKPAPYNDIMLKGEYGKNYGVMAGNGSQYTSVAPVAEVDFMNMNIRTQMTNPNAKAFLTEVTYTDASTSVIGTYNKVPAARRDQPSTAIIPLPDSNQPLTLRFHAIKAGAEEAYPHSQLTYNVPAHTTEFEVANLFPRMTNHFVVEADGQTVAQGSVRDDESRLRMIKAMGVSNIRDLGGWINDEGRQIRYGMIYRGGEFNGTNNHWAPDASKQLIRDLGIRAELDLRSWSVDNKATHSSSALDTIGGINVEPSIYFRASNQWDSGTEALQNDTTRAKWAEDLNFIMDHVLADEPVYFHCVWGADRTGIMSLLIEGLLGQTEDAIYKNYELTSFSWAGTREKTGMENKVAYIKTFAGSTLQKKFVTYCTTILHLDAEKINAFRDAMLEEESKVETSIEKIEDERLKIEYSSSHGVYDMSGRKVQSLKKGIYIINGKKVIIK